MEHWMDVARRRREREERFEVIKTYVMIGFSLVLAIFLIASIFYPKVPPEKVRHNEIMEAITGLQKSLATCECRVKEVKGE